MKKDAYLLKDIIDIIESNLGVEEIFSESYVSGLSEHDGDPIYLLDMIVSGKPVITADTLNEIPFYCRVVRFEPTFNKNLKRLVLIFKEIYIFASENELIKYDNRKN